MPKAVLVEWRDAISTHGWEALDAVGDCVPKPCSTLGFLVFEAPDFLVVAATWGKDGEAEETNNRISIPTGWITSRKDIAL